MAAVFFFREHGLIAFIDDFGDDCAVISDIDIAANDGEIGCMAILIGGSKIYVGISGKIVHTEITDIDEGLHLMITVLLASYGPLTKMFVQIPRHVFLAFN